MQPIRRLLTFLASVADAERCLFSVADLAGALPEVSRSGLAVLLSRAVSCGELERVCRGIYLYPRSGCAPGLVSARAAARLRAGTLLYVSLESALSEHGAISQVPVDRLTLMTSGRRGVIDCGRFGVVELTHTQRKPEHCRGRLAYDPERRLWVASPKLALEDLVRVGRNLDLVDRDVLEGGSHARIR